MNCSRCNSPLEPGQKFCSNCGQPQPMQNDLKCPKCHADISPNQKFCTVCGEKLPAVNTTTPGSNHTFQPHISSNLIECPECGRMTDSLKQATLFNKLLFLMIYTQWQMVTYTCCPQCMRKHIANRSAATLITGNFIWPILALPLHGFHLYKSYQRGHSGSIANLMHN